jgi:hypothetical protein
MSWADCLATFLTYNDTVKFRCFIDWYAKQAVENCNFGKWMKLNGSKILLDRNIPSDMAYTIVVYEDSIDGWRGELQMKARSKTKEGRQRAQRYQNPKYHHAMGKCIECYSDGWTCVGKEY